MSVELTLNRFAQRNQLDEQQIIALYGTLSRKKDWEVIFQLLPHSPFPNALLSALVLLFNKDHGRLQQPALQFLKLLHEIQSENPIFSNLGMIWLHAESDQLIAILQDDSETFQRWLNAFEFAAQRYPSLAFGLDEFTFFMRILQLYAQFPELAQCSLQRWIQQLPNKPNFNHLTKALEELFIKHQISNLVIQHIPLLSCFELTSFVLFNHGINRGAYLENRLTKKEAFRYVSWQKKPIKWSNRPLERSILYLQLSHEQLDSTSLFDLLNCHSGFRFQLTEFRAQLSFWTTVFHYLQAQNVPVKTAKQQSELVNWFDYLQYKKNENPEWRFRSKLTWADQLNQMDEWVRALQIQKELKQKANIQWKSKQSLNFESTIGQETILISELTSRRELIQEGFDMHHCVATFADLCKAGKARIFTYRTSVQPEKPVLTIEIRKNTIVQIRGKYNRLAQKQELAHIAVWKKTFGLY